MGVMWGMHVAVNQYTSIETISIIIINVKQGTEQENEDFL